MAVVMVVVPAAGGSAVAKAMVLGAVAVKVEAATVVVARAEVATEVVVVAASAMGVMGCRERSEVEPVDTEEETAAAAEECSRT